MSTMRQTKQSAGSIEASLVVLGPPWGPLGPWECHMPILGLDEVVKNKKPFYMGKFLWEGQK